VDTALTPEDMAVAAEDHRALLARLPVDQRSIVELRLAGLTDAEVAETLGRSVGAVKSAQFRALARLRHLLTSEANPREGNLR
jgi:RNA polymerase sigma-70 factor, ECF subfamily